MKLAAACSSAMGFQVESVAGDLRDVCSGCWLIALTGCPLYQKELEKIVLGGKKESMHSGFRLVGYLC